MKQKLEAVHTVLNAVLQETDLKNEKALHAVQSVIWSAFTFEVDRKYYGCWTIGLLTSMHSLSQQLWQPNGTVKSMRPDAMLKAKNFAAEWIGTVEHYLNHPPQVQTPPKQGT